MPFVLAGPMVEVEFPTVAKPESAKLICANPLLISQLLAQLTKQELSALTAVDPNFPAAGAN